MGGKGNYYAQVAKQFGDNNTVALGYGSQYLGENNRLYLTMNSGFTLAQLWQGTADRSADRLKGGATLKKYNQDMTDFFKSDAKSPTVAALSQVYEQDVARKLITQDIGGLTHDIEDLRKAGAILDNTRVRGMVGFVTN